MQYRREVGPGCVHAERAGPILQRCLVQRRARLPGCIVESHLLYHHEVRITSQSATGSDAPISVACSSNVEVGFGQLLEGMVNTTYDTGR